MTHSLPSRPNTDHLRSQAKSLLAAWQSGDRDATQAFIDHLPKAREFSIAEARRAPFRLADAQSVIARRSGFASWTALTRHVDLLRSLEGEWHFESLQVDGHDMPSAMLGHSKLRFDGDRFQMASPEGNYDGTFVIDTTAKPMLLDIAFVEGPEAGNSSYGIFTLEDDSLTICLGLVGLLASDRVQDHRRKWSRARADASRLDGAAGRRHWWGRADAREDRRRTCASRRCQRVRPGDESNAQAAGGRVGTGASRHEW